MAHTYDFLCPACTRIFSDNALNLFEKGASEEWKFHSTLGSMLDAELDGCRLCNLVLLSSGENIRSLKQGEADVSSEYQSSKWNYKLAMFSKPDSPLFTNKEIYVLSFSLDSVDPVPFTACISSINPLLAKNIAGRRVSTERSMGDSTLQQINNWISNCLQHHETCRDSWMLVAAERRLPTRLVDVSNAELFKVVDTKHLSPSTIYFTLSHRWSSIPITSLTTKTYDAFHREIPASSISKTFQEAIEFTRLLGVHYVWIDSLCIIQDSREDWLHESSMMGEVYAHGTLNIAATSSEDGNGGIFGRNSTDDSLLPRLVSSRQWGVTDDREYIIYSEFDPAFPEVWKNAVEETPLGERGWVLQERILSPRVVHFAANQCFWECCQETEAELFPKETFRHDGFLKQIVLSVPPDHAIFDQNQNVLYTYWDALIEKYSRCDLTFESDKLVAFAGLAKRACRQLNLDPSDYLAGLWRPKIAQGLLWRVAKYDPRRRSVTGRGPSWGWTSREGTVYTFSEEVQLWETERCHITVIETEMFHDGDPFGQVTGGRLVVRGFLFKDVSTFLKDPNAECANDDEMEYRNSCFLLVLTHQSGTASNSAVISGLILVPTEIKRGQFRRVGVMLNQEIDDLNILLEHGKKADFLDELYEEEDSDNGFNISNSDHGFTIELV